MPTDPVGLGQLEFVVAFLGLLPRLGGHHPHLRMTTNRRLRRVQRSAHDTA
jgi:hypothetical protein